MGSAAVGGKLSAANLQNPRGGERRCWQACSALGWMMQVSWPPAAIQNTGRLSGIAHRAGTAVGSLR